MSRLHLLNGDEALEQLKLGAMVYPVYDHGGALLRFKMSGKPNCTPEDVADYAEDAQCSGFLVSGQRAYTRGSADRIKALFMANLESGRFVHLPTGAEYPSSSVDDHLPGKLGGKRPSQWLRQHNYFNQTFWDPGFEQIARDRAYDIDGWREQPGNVAYNAYRKPQPIGGIPTAATRWLDHWRALYPTEWEHIVMWLATKVQQPDVKINHALMLIGKPGIGKDLLLEPLRYAVGESNFRDISPQDIFGQFNEWARSVILRVNEAHDLGDQSRFGLHDRMKTLIAAPPSQIPINRKFQTLQYAKNVCGVIITSNHVTDGLYLEADDRRHYVASSRADSKQFGPEYFADLAQWYECGGYGHVVAYLDTLDVSDFDPKAPPPKTAAFYAIARAQTDPVDDGLRELIGGISSPLPDVLVLSDLRNMAYQLGSPLDTSIFEQKAARSLPHKMARAGYQIVNNPDRSDGRWRVGKKPETIYANADLQPRQQFEAVRTEIDRLGAQTKNGRT